MAKKKLGQKILSFLGGDLVSDVGNIIDDLVTTEEEKLDAKARINALLIEADNQAQEQVTRRWEADSKTDSFLSKNIRPMALIFLTAMFTIISIFDGNIGTFEINEAYRPIYQSLLVTVYGAYFVGRTTEKGINIYQNAKTQ